VPVRSDRSASLGYLLATVGCLLDLVPTVVSGDAAVMARQQPTDWDLINRRQHGPVPATTYPEQHLVVRRHGLTVVTRMRFRAAAAVLVLAALHATGALTAGSGLVIVSAAGAWSGLVWLRWRSETLTLSPFTVTLRTGLLSRSCRVIPLEAVQDVASRVPLVGLLLGFGTVVITLRAGAAQQLTAVPNAPGLRDRILAARLHTGRSS
jgi:membrane protein YdbS with pleckstrin-like domain